MSPRPTPATAPEGAVWIETACLQAAANPFRDFPWGKPTVTPDQVRACLKRGIHQVHIEEDWMHLNRKGSYHAARIATLLVEGWTDPIQLDVGIPELGHVGQLIQDGYHRLGAAILAEDPWICVDIAGSVAHARHLFGKQYPQPPNHLPASAKTRMPVRLDV